MSQSSTPVYLRRASHKLHRSICERIPQTQALTFSATTLRKGCPCHNIGTNSNDTNYAHMSVSLPGSPFGLARLSKSYFPSLDLIRAIQSASWMPCSSSARQQFPAKQLVLFPSGKIDELKIKLKRAKRHTRKARSAESASHRWTKKKDSTPLALCGLA